MSIVRAPCSHCHITTRHNVLYEVQRDPHELHHYFLLQCGGCGTISLDQVSSYKSKHERHEYYPPPSARELPSWIGDFYFGPNSDERSTAIADLFYEIHRAVAARLPRLAAMGIRALLEQVMIDRVGDHGRFDKHLEEFHKQGYVSLLQRDALAAVLDVGHAVTHRYFAPTEEELNTAQDIVEGVLVSIFEHGDAAAKLGNRVPPRLPRMPKP